MIKRRLLFVTCKYILGECERNAMINLHIFNFSTYQFMNGDCVNETLSNKFCINATVKGSL